MLKICASVMSAVLSSVCRGGQGAPGLGLCSCDGDMLRSADFPTIQMAIDAAVQSGKTLVLEPEARVNQITTSGRLRLIARGRTICDHDGRNGPWFRLLPGAEYSELEFEEIDFGGHGTIGIQLDAGRCRVLIRRAHNMNGLPYADANRQCAVLSQGDGNVIDVTADDFRLGSSDNGSVPRVVTTDRGSSRNLVRVKAYKTNTVWVENGEDNTADYVIAEAVTDNGIYNLSGSLRMRCNFLHYTNSKEEAFVLEGETPYIRKAIYDGWSYPGVQNCTGAVVDEILLLPPPDVARGGVGTCVLRSRDGNVRSDITIRLLSGDLYVGSKADIGAYLHFYVGNVDYCFGEQKLRVHYLPGSKAENLVVHRHGSRVELGSTHITFDDSLARPPRPLVWNYPAEARFDSTVWRQESKCYDYLVVRRGR